MSSLSLLFFVLSLIRSYSTGCLYSNHTYLKQGNSGNPFAPYTSKPVLTCFKQPKETISEVKCIEYKKMLATEQFILGGRPAETNEFPHMGAIGWKAKDTSVMWIFKCGCTLISDKFLVTAAHCSKLSSSNDLNVSRTTPEVVRLGVIDISDDEIGKFTDMEIKRIIKNPNYAAPKMYYDIALIELNEEVKFSKSVHPACLWRHHEFNGLDNKVMVIGWGNTESGRVGRKSEILQVATVSLIETSVCDQLLKPYYNRNWDGLQDHQMCAGELAGGVDTCQGDSGGPINTLISLETKPKLYYILGVTSFGSGCGYPNRPGIYTRISSFIDWIEEVVWEDIK